MAKAVAFHIWNSSRNIRDCIKIDRIAKSIEDINFIVSTFMRKVYDSVKLDNDFVSL
jgi:hypothetical protein